jgi:DNA-binding response OmpR family regulator
MDYLSQLKVLVIEPSGYTGRVIRDMLENGMGVPVTMHAKTGADGRGVLTQARINLLIVKVDPDCPDGITLIEAVRAGLNDVPDDMPIIAMTAAPTRQLVEQLRDNGVNEILALPLTAKSLAARIQSVFEHPREWVVSATFVGPDRRRKAKQFNGGERREETVFPGEESQTTDAAPKPQA